MALQKSVGEHSTLLEQAKAAHKAVVAGHRAQLSREELDALRARPATPIHATPTELTRFLGQLQASERDLQSKFWANLQNSWAFPVDASL